MQTHDNIKKMKNKVEALLKERHGWLTLADLVELQLIPWARDARTIVRLIDADIAGAKILKAQVTGDGRQRRYLIRGSAITKYIKIYGPAMMATARKPKHVKSKKVRG